MPNLGAGCERLSKDPVKRNDSNRIKCGKNTKSLCSARRPDSALLAEQSRWGCRTKPIWRVEAVERGTAADSTSVEPLAGNLKIEILFVLLEANPKGRACYYKLQLVEINEGWKNRPGSDRAEDKTEK